uniref:NADH-ubiquinone oxidoreductase chain 6 n=1 Tax=Phanerochaete carnosa TaxID=231932 RepID=A0A895KTA8_9APHY|nr:NADH dehydrogenase subunit 6 [Phanerochaete carnosa]QRZ60396.1 NADH dehydrogenase subunit 6 [Phanerochaete carnosa]
MKNLFIDILAFGALLSSVLVITSKNPVIAVIFLISVFINAAGYLILLGIGFIGISYIIVYIGAITVLFLFVIMLLNIRLIDLLEAGSLYTKNIPLAVAIGFLFIYEIFTIIPFSFNDVSLISSLLNLVTNLNGLFLNSDISTVNVVYNTINPILADSTFTNFTQIQALGQSLYTFGAFWLIITSVILLLSMVAPIFISKQNK